MRTVRSLLLLGTAAILLFAGSAFAAASGIMSIDHVVGLISGDTVAAGQNLRFVIRMNNNTAVTQDVSIGWRVLSTDGAVFDSVTIDSCGPNSGGACKINQYFNITSQFFVYAGQPVNGPDTVGYLGATSHPLTGGLPVAWDDTMFAVVVYVDTASKTTNNGKHICIDSSFFQPGGTWVWYDPKSVLVPYYPEWVGLGSQVHQDGSGYCFVLYNSASAVNERDNGLPRSFAVSQNYPNPFNPTTKINFDVPVKSEVKLSIYNVLGQKVTTLINKSMQPGKYQVDWAGRNDGGTQVASGIYFYKFEAGSFVQTRKMILLK